MKAINLTKVEEPGEYEKLPAGGYLCQITSVTYNADKDYLKIEFDLVEGDFKGYYRQLFDATGFWAGNFIKSCSEKAEQFFLQFINRVAESNPVFNWNMEGETDETKLLHKYVGLVLGEEEYRAKDGAIKKRLYVAEIKSMNDIRAKKYKIPELKVLTDSPVKKPAGELAPVNNADLPF